MSIRKCLKDNLPPNALNVARNCSYKIAYEYHKIANPEYVFKKMFKARLGYSLDLDSPKTFNEKLQWLKLHDNNPLYTTMVDKYAVKQYVAEKIGEQYIIPTLGIWEHFDEIDFDKLPNQFVLKCTHDSGSIVIVPDKFKMDKLSAKKKLENGLKHNFYYVCYEWPYKNVPPRIIAEKFMVDESGVELKDYKVFNFDGIPKAIQVDYDRFTNHKRNIYDAEWKYINMSIEYPTDANHQIAKPKNLEKMLELAGKLSEGIPQARTDFYVINDEIYFGEITFYYGAGLEHFMPEKYDGVFGEWIKLPDVSRGGTSS